jgi:methylated-DNA-protein-cysteine methyltransferase related protein
MTRFAERVLALVARVPPGRVATYGDIARLAGRAGAARAVGTLMRTARRPGLPYHRIVAAAGRLGGYGNSPHLKAALLAAEGVIVRRGRILRFEQHRWRPPRRTAARNARA